MSLDSVRTELLAEARGRADAILADADARVREQLASARREADALIERARAEGAVEGEREAARDEAGERFTAHLLVLAAQRESYDELRRRIRAAAVALRREPDYPVLLERLRGAARRDLGDAAEIEADPPDVGGVRARSGTRAVDYTLPALADRCVARLGPRQTHLWT